ncbi:MAG: biosynthetic-type acetolactate synthase large subunit, partial [Peptostreptococcales bacterium]
MMQLTGSQVVMECLKEQSVEYIFGYPGGAIMPVYDAMYDYRDKVKHILTSHEQGAVHAADGYARVTGKVGVCFCTSGPGATNTVTGIATAYMDSVPLVVIAGQVGLSLIGKDSFQEVDVTGVTLPITKHNYFVDDIEELADIIREAFYIAKEGRPGPVLIDLPKNIMIERTEFESKVPKTYTVNKDFDQSQLEEIGKLINEAKRPIIYAGGGIIIANADQELRELADRAEIPVTNSLMGLGSYPRDGILSLGMVGMHGSKEANLAMNRSDLVLALGARFSDRVTGDPAKFAPKAKIVHIDIDKSEISKNVKAHYSIIGDVKIILGQLLPLVEEKDRKNWIHEVKQWAKPLPREDRFVAKNIFRIADAILGEDTLIVTEVGQHQMWVAQSWPFRKARSFITSGGLGTMGYGLGAAIG